MRKLPHLRGLRGMAAFAVGAMACGGLVETSSSISHGSTDLGDAGLDAQRPEPLADAADDSWAPQTPVQDDVCTQTDVGNGILDPDCVYISGSLSPGSAWAGIIFHPERPEDFAGAARFGLFNAVRPSDGRLLYTAEAIDEPNDPAPNRAKVFAYRGPRSVTSNAPPGRERVPGVVCDKLSRPGFLVFPEDGALLYDCDDTLLVAGSPPMPLYRGAYRALATSYDRSIFAEGESSNFAWIKDGSIVEIDAFEGDVVALRSKTGGFMGLATWRQRAGEGILEFHEIAPDGTVKLIGEYAPLDPHLWRSAIWCALEPTRDLVCYVDSNVDRIQRVFRFSLTHDPVMIFDESLHEQKLHGQELVTGP